MNIIIQPILHSGRCLDLKFPLVGKRIRHPVTTSSTSLWNNVATGYIPQGDRKGYYTRYKRENITSNLPVDSSGNLLAPNVNVLSGVVSSSDDITKNWRFGDGAPAEQAWKKTSAYPFALVKLLFLARPGEFIKYYNDVDSIIKLLQASTVSR